MVSTVIIYKIEKELEDIIDDLRAKVLAIAINNCSVINCNITKNN